MRRPELLWLLTTLRLVSLFVGVAPALPVSAYRVEYVLTYEGERLSGGEVCFYHGGFAADAFALFFPYADDVRCVSADHVLDIPPGLIHVFARHPDGYASGDRDFLVYRGPEAPEQGYERLEIPLEPAGTVDLARWMEHARLATAGLWFRESDASLSVLVPLVTGETSVMVPANREFVPVGIRAGLPVMFGHPSQVQLGETDIVKEDSPSRGLIVPIDIEGALAAQLPDHADAPQITLNSTSESIEPLFPVADPSKAGESLLFFDLTDASENSFELLLEGRFWLPGRIGPISVANGQVTSTPEVLGLQPASTLSVMWDGPGSTETGDCPLPPLYEFHLMACPDQRCDVATDWVEVDRASATAGDFPLEFEHLKPGTYTITVATEEENQRLMTPAVDLGVHQEVAVAAPFFVVHGRVTRGGVPVESELQFSTGRAVSDSSTGAYTALLFDDPLLNVVEIRECTSNESWVRRIATRLTSGSVLDLPVDGELVVEILDEDSGAPVEGAEVRVRVWTDTDRGPLSHIAGIGFSDEGGTARVGGIGSEEDVQLNVIASGYHILWKEKMPAHRVGRIELTPSAVTKGKILSDHPAQSLDGAIYIFDLFGRVSEVQTVSPDGQFELRLEHRSDEKVVYVGQSHPLVVMPLPSATNGSVDIVVPAAPVRSFVVRSASRPTDQLHLVGLFIGDTAVPVDALAQHLDLNGGDISLAGGDQIIANVVASAPLSVSIAPWLDDPDRLNRVFNLPEFQSLPRFMVPDDGVVVVTPGGGTTP